MITTPLVVQIFVLFSGEQLRSLLNKSYTFHRQLYTDYGFIRRSTISSNKYHILNITFQIFTLKLMILSPFIFLSIYLVDPHSKRFIFWLIIGNTQSWPTYIVAFGFSVIITLYDTLVIVNTVYFGTITIAALICNILYWSHRVIK